MMKYRFIYKIIIKKHTHIFILGGFPPDHPVWDYSPQVSYHLVYSPQVSYHLVYSPQVSYPLVYSPQVSYHIFFCYCEPRSLLIVLRT